MYPMVSFLSGEKLVRPTSLGVTPLNEEEEDLRAGGVPTTAMGGVFLGCMDGYDAIFLTPRARGGV